MIAFPENEAVEAWEWPEGAVVTMTIDHAPDLLWTGVAAVTSWGDSRTYLRFDFADQYNLQVGDVVTLDDDTTERSHTVLNLAITALDTEAEIITGMADSGALVDVWPHGFDEIATIHTTAGGDGAWAADFMGLFDLSAELGGRSQIRDDFGSATAVDWIIPNQRIFAQYADDHIRFEYSAPGAEITFSIFDSLGTLLWEESRTADEAGSAAVSIWEHHLELIPNMQVRASEGAIAKNLLLEPLSLEVFDPDENFLAGTAAPGREVWVVANNDPEFCGKVVTADTDGNWSYDFDDQGCDVYDPAGTYAQVTDGEGDTTEVFLDFIDGWHDYDQGDVPNWACNAGGWAVDSDDRARDLEIRILADGETEAEVVASTTAGNPAELFGVCGEDGACGYEVNLWGAITPYEEHQIFVQALDEETGQWFNLNGTPRPLTCRSYDIYTYDPESGETIQVTNLPDTDEYDPSWSPNNRFIAHEVIGGDSFEIYVTQVASGASLPLEETEGGLNPAWSPNGLWIAFDRGAVDDPNLYVVPFAGGRRRLVMTNAISPSWSPSGWRLVYQDPEDGGSLKAGGLLGGPVFLVADFGANPAWSPDGKWIAFQKDGDIWKVRVNPLGNPTGQPVQLTSLPAWEDMPAWSADSQTVLFHAGLDRDFDLWQVPAGGGPPTWLTGAPGFGDYDPAAAKNGQVAYASFSPAGQAARIWQSAYTYDLPAGLLAEGIFQYHFEFEWSSPEPGSVTGQQGEFSVSTEAQFYDGCVLLRAFFELAGYDLEDGLVCEEVSEIHPDQPARFLAGWATNFPMTYAEAVAHYESLTTRVVWGEGSSVELQRHEILPFTSAENRFQYLCTFSRKTELDIQAFLPGMEVFLPLMTNLDP
jgi:hypothetical protein